MDIDRVLARQERMEGRRANWESLWESVARLVLPISDDFRSGHSPGGQRNQQQYDAFPQAALDKFAAAIEAGTMPRQTYWHRMTTGDPELDQRQEVQAYLEEVNQTLWRERYHPLGNFASQAHETRISLGAFGTGCVLIEPRKGGGIKYRAIHLSEIFIEENAEGIVDTIHRKFSLGARQAIQLFGKDTPQKIIDRYQSGKTEDRFEFMHIVQPKEETELGFPTQGRYMFEKSFVGDEPERFRSNPYIVSRYATSTREIYGRSPAIMMLPDISMLNEMRRTVIEAANMAVDKPVLMHEDVSEFDLTPGTRNPGTLDDNGNPMARPWDDNSRVDIGMEMIADTRAQIDDGFLGVYFRVLLENPNMTATQAMLIAQQQGQMTAPTVGRLQNEWLGPQIRRERSILFSQGKLPQMPQILAQRGKALEIEYETPMTRQAKNEEGVGLLRAFEALAGPAQVDPSVYDKFDFDKVAEIVSEVNGVPARALKSDEQLAQERAQEQTSQTMQQMVDAAPVMANTAKTLAETQQMQMPS